MRGAVSKGYAEKYRAVVDEGPEKIPRTFAEDFRRVRNIVNAHVKFERSDLSLTNFYDQYHKYLYMLYRDVQSWWGRLSDEFPDLNEITRFSVVVRDTSPSQALPCPSPSVPTTDRLDS